MQECFLLGTDIYKAGIQPGHDLFHAAMVDIAHRKCLCLFFPLELYQLLLFGDCNGNLLGMNIYKKFACHNTVVLFCASFTSRRGAWPFSTLKQKTNLRLCLLCLQVCFLCFDRLSLTCSYVCSFSVFFYACALTFYVFFSSFRLA